MSDDILRPLFDWRAAVASKSGPASATTRHVLLTLGLHMSAKGDSCFPSIALLSEETGRSKKCIIDHINLAVEQGWLEKSVKGSTGQGWRRHEYRATIPNKGGESITPPVNQGGIAELPPLTEGGVIQGEKVVYAVHTSSSKSSSIKTPSPKKPATSRQQKKPANPNHSWFVKWWCFVCATRTGTPYAFTKKDAGIIKRLLGQLGLNELTVRACAYLLLPEQKRFPRGAPTLGGLQCQINEVTRFDDEMESQFVDAGLLPDFDQIDTLTDFTPWSCDHEPTRRTA